MHNDSVSLEWSEIKDKMETSMKPKKTFNWHTLTILGLRGFLTQQHHFNAPEA